VQRCAAISATTELLLKKITGIFFVELDGVVVLLVVEDTAQLSTPQVIGIQTVKPASPPLTSQP